MRVLVSAASRHGATTGIAAAIRDELEGTGVDVDLIVPEKVIEVQAYDAVVLGSAVYAGRWLPTARELVERLADELSNRPVWLFSSGPIGDPAKPAQPPADGLELAHRTNAVDHQVFEGRIDREGLSFGERAIVRIVGATDGDFRPWDAVRAWAARIAATLTPADAPEPEGLLV